MKKWLALLIGVASSLAFAAEPILIGGLCLFALLKIAFVG